jgi:prepilin-type N-terminal cleavage/methylation domain-containing protein
MTRSRGFTLLEMMVSMTISLIALAAGMSVLIVQAGTMKQQAGLGSAVAQSELGLDYMERAVRLAGTGIDPQFGFDFDFYRCALPGLGAAMNESANCAAATRDSITAADELVIAYRDPGFSLAAVPDTRAGCTAANAATYAGKVWGVTAASNASVTLLLKPGDVLYRGQVLQLACSNGATYTYATVSQGRTGLAGTTCAATTLSLYGSVANDPFNQSGFLAAGCFSDGTARAYAVRRNRFFVYRDVASTPPRPYLMLDQGLDLDDSGALDDADLLPIASDIEDLQVAYATEQPGILALAAQPTGWTAANFVKDTNADGVWGNDPGRVEQLTELATVAGTVPNQGFASATATLQGGTPYLCSSYATIGFFNYPCLYGVPPVESSSTNNIHAYRWVAWSGGITQVLLGMVARSPGQDAAEVTRSENGTIPALFNRTAATAPFPAWYAAIAPAGHRRVVMTTSIHPTNMAALVPYWN